MSRRDSFSEVLAAGRRHLPILFVLSFLANILLLTTSIYMLQVFDRVLSSGSTDTLIWLTVIAVFALVTYGFLEHARRIILQRTGSWIENELSPAIIKRAIAARLTKGRSDAAVGDVADIRGFVAGDAILAFLDAPWSPAFIALIWMMHPMLGLIAVLGAVVLFLLAVLNDVMTRQRAAVSARSLRASRSEAEHFVENAETLAGLGMIDTVVSRWKKQLARAEDDGIVAADISSLLFNISRVIRLGLQLAILGVGAWLVLGAELTAGGMIAASIILSRALSPVERAISAWKSFGSYRNARARLQQLFKAHPEPERRVSLPRPEGRLDVRDLRFHSPETREPILRGLTFELEPGDICAVIGPSGSGKTTLCKLLVGAWHPSFGSVRLDGADVAEWDSEELGRYLGYVPQSVELFDGTIAENIARMREVDDAQVIAAAQQAGAHQMILKLPKAYETPVGHYADRLSGGQKQRVGLARALYGDPSFLVLDEPNANLDGNGEIALLKALRQLKKEGRTVLIVSHLPNVLSVVDKILFIKDGTLGKFGTRDEILAEMREVRARKERPAPQPAVATISTIRSGQQTAGPIDLKTRERSAPGDGGRKAPEGGGNARRSPLIRKSVKAVG